MRQSRREYVDVAGAGVVGLMVMASLFMIFAAWLTHIVWAIQTLASETGATTGQIAISAAGVLLPPVGVVHGLIIWFA